jgi:hypothetical protein
MLSLHFRKHNNIFIDFLAIYYIIFTAWGGFMETRSAIRFMNDINTVLSFIDGCLQYDEIYNLKLRDVGDEIHFTIQRGKYDVPVEEISKLDENTMRMLYAAIAARYSGHIELGATMERKNGDIIWNLAPVIGDRTMIELISGDPKDQEWFYEELKEATKQKGLK